MLRVCSFLALCLLAAAAADAAIPRVEDLPPVAVDAAEAVMLAMPDLAPLAAEDKAADLAGGPYRFAVPLEVALTPASAGRWSDLPGRDLAAWRLRVTVPGARSLNLAFVTCALPDGGELVLRPAGGGRALRFAAADLDGGELWTPLLQTDDLVVEVVVPRQARRQVAVELSRVNAGYRAFGGEDPGKAGSCNVDVVCSEGDPWRAEIRSVGVYQINGVLKCTGAMVNSTARDGTPLFLTAAHCGVTEANDASVVVYWNYESPVCGQQGGGSFDDAQTGALLRAVWPWFVGSVSSDLCLIELENVPDPAWRVTYAGWNRGDAAPTSSVAIHHPSTDEKSISFDDDPATVTDYLDTAVPGDASHLRIGAWDLGTTEPGSSGSPLFDQDHRIVGQLHGGYASCTQPLASDWYGRLAHSWAGDGAAANRLSDWLDPLGTGAVTVDLYDPLGGRLTVAAAADLSFGGPIGGPFTPAAVAVTLGNDGEAAIGWNAAADAAWLAVSPASGDLAPGETVTVSVAPSAAAGALASGVHSASVAFTNSDGGQGDTTLPAVIAVLGRLPELVSAGPNPMLGYCTITYTLGAAAPVRGRVFDLRGRRVADLGSRDGTAGVNTWSWDGRDGAGRRMPGGRYVFELEAAGGRIRVPLTVAH